MAGRITVSVDAEVADAYRAASDADRRKLDLLINLRLREATHSERALRDLMQDVSRNARRRGADSRCLAVDPERKMICNGHDRSSAG